MRFSRKLVLDMCCLICALTYDDAIIFLAGIMIFVLLIGGCATPEHVWPDPVQVPSGEDIGSYPDKGHEWRSCN